MIFLIMTLGDHFCEVRYWIGNRAAVRTAMKIPVGSRDFYFDIT